MQSNRRGLASTLVIFGIVANFSGASTQSDAADECLSGPKGGTPEGKHWYYRIERPSKRHCWYLGDEGKRTSREAVAAEIQSDEPAPEKTPQPKQEPIRSSVANARAELTPDLSVPFTTAPQIAPVARNEVPQTRSWPLAERWVDPQPAMRVVQEEPRPPAPAQMTQGPPRQSAIQATARAASDGSPDMLHMILGIATAAIALAAIFGRLIASHMKPRVRATRPRAIWQTADERDSHPVNARAQMHDPSLRARAEEDVEQLLRALRYPEAQPLTLTSRAASANRGRMPRDRSGARA